jgi:uncharacterized protein YuzE
MAENLIFRYDKIGDILYIDTCLPYPEQETEEIGDEIIARFNPASEKVENLEILFFSQRLDTLHSLKLPINAALTLTH